MAVYLAPAEFTDSGHPVVTAKAGELCASTRSRRDAARAVFYYVRDLRYEGGDFEDLEIYRASSVLAAGHGYCVGKAALCTALARAVGIPARLGFADVRNHLASPRLLAAMGTDIFAWHGYSQLFLSGHWVSVSPTFDPGTCRRAGVPPLDFDGEHDALLQSFDATGATMAYLKRHGLFHDVPAQFLAAEMQRLYPVRGRSRHYPVPGRRQGHSLMTRMTHLHADLLTAARQYPSEVADGRDPDQGHSYA